MNSAGCSMRLPANAASSSWLRSMLRYQLMPPANVPWCENDSTNTSRSASESHGSGPGRSRHHVGEARGRGVEEPVLVAGDVARQPVEDRAERAPEVGVELAPRRRPVLEVQDVEERVAERGPHRLGGHGSGASAPSPPRRSARSARPPPAKRSGRSNAQCHATGPPQSWPTTTAVSIPNASSTPTMSPTRCSWVYSSTAERAIGGAVAALVGREHVVAGVAERLQLVAPRVPALGEAVAQHDRGTVGGTGLGDVHAQAVAVDVVGARSRQCSARSRSAVGSRVRSAARNAAVSGNARCTSDSSSTRTRRPRPRQSSTWPPARAVVGEEVQVVARDLHARRVGRRPEADHRAVDTAPELELRLLLGGDGQRDARRGAARGAHVHRVEAGRRRAPRRTRWPSRASRRRRCVSAARSSTASSSTASGSPKRVTTANGVVASSGTSCTSPRRRHAEHVAVEHHHLAVEILEGAEAEVAVLAHHAHRHRALVHALHQRAGGRHLVQRVVLDAEVLGQRALDQVVARRAAAAGRARRARSSTRASTRACSSGIRAT